MWRSQGRALSFLAAMMLTWEQVFMELGHDEHEHEQALGIDHRLSPISAVQAEVLKINGDLHRVW